MSYPRIAIIVVYIGQLPKYFPLWLKSCAFNADFDWLIFTDADSSCYDAPRNVRFRPISLRQFNAKISAALGIETQVSRPYKICDFRPAFSLLLQEEAAAYDFWGHCDLDMIFGDLRRFIPPDLLANHDKIFSVGHFTLYRNNQITNSMYRRPHPHLDWGAIFTDPNHHGFDEHHGVNQLWKAQRGRYFEDESLIADIDPSISRFERIAPRQNHRDQLFIFDAGRIYRGYYESGRWCLEESMYIHFPKRHFDMARSLVNASKFYIGPNGFTVAEDAIPTLERLREINGYSFHWSEMIHRRRARFRKFRRTVAAVIGA